MDLSIPQAAAEQKGKVKKSTNDDLINGRPLTTSPKPVTKHCMAVSQSAL